MYIHVRTCVYMYVHVYTCTYISTSVVPWSSYSTINQD